jgi:hypothetical protein
MKDMTHNRHLFLLFTLLTVLNVRGQALNRAYLSMGLGLLNCKEFGATYHGFNHFSAAYYHDMRAIQVGPDNFPKPEYKATYARNYYTMNTILVGWTTKTLKRVNWSLTTGPSWIDAVECDKFVVHTNDISHMQWLTASTIHRKTVGLAVRSDVVIRIVDRAMGINLSVQGNFNAIRTDVMFLFGINCGIIDDWSDPAWRRKPEF